MAIWQSCWLNVIRLQPGYFSRMRAYLSEMYPVPSRLALSSLTYFGVMSLLREIHGIVMPVTFLLSLVGIGSLFSLMLVIRLMDELKDKDSDREHFPYRPLPSGRVFESDIAATIAACSLFYMLANITSGASFWGALLALTYAFLMFKHFFIPRILKKSLLLTVATHNPLVPIMLFYILTVFSVETRVPLSRIDWSASLLLIFMNWAIVFAWEIARKTRCEEEETAYVTYSQ
ncbi:MAG: hypothetical protein OEN50_19840, partial [Deltaproteobacteria bacterium]|nr:hypothetical protein [Deltaproteobacteria bacterium]